MLWKRSANMVLSRVFTCQPAAYCAAIHGEGADMTQCPKFSKTPFQNPTTAKTTIKTTNSTTKEIFRTPIFVSVKNLIRLFLRIISFKRKCVQF